MLKTRFSLYVLLAMLTGLFVFTACDDDEENVVTTQQLKGSEIRHTIQQTLSGLDRMVPYRQDATTLVYNRDGAPIAVASIDLLSSDYNITVCDGRLFIHGHLDLDDGFIKEGVPLRFYQKAGTTEENCCQFVERFNHNVSINLSLNGTSFGKATYMTRLDASMGKYRPVMNVTSPLFGNAAQTVPELSTTLGCILDDLLQLLKK